ncbi:sulfotransferase domain-containing protein [Gloeocapsopsis dulcis]|uniref:Sulfotransferase n=1 Tax=Gloeocapsopsis dulcis AAB1 = 1H9 TaxID=1433147 RepID=A0A6N8G2B7_9CHRO|nr:sulfotransferase domain-containing protein [Gloeocapsopsis dulcis]MUL39032.1 sulfotransferase [Gloeocapsopsis dulcis AAB1 = 1H9]WNN90559.1 sulfotransferase [Gloeocapsopsis dulcis]
MTLPNFLVIGAAKAGTTALYYYLKQHPQIYMSPEKEPKFFALEGDKLDFRGPGDRENICKSAITDIETYHQLFKGVTNEIAVGEASPLYLYSPVAAERIKKYIPHAKLIAILRNPIERAYSGYIMHVREGRETAKDFAEALQEEEARIRNNWGWGHYVSVGLYHTQLKRYLDLFDKEQIRVYLYEDLKANPISLVQDVFKFIGVEHTFLPDTSLKYNVAGVPKNNALRILIRNFNSLKPAVNFLLPDKLRHYVRGQVFEKPPVLSHDIRQSLIEVYREDVSNLQNFLQRDLSHWLE